MLIADAPLAHAITDLAGRFLNVDDQFCALIRRERTDIVGRTILEVTAEPFRTLNTDMLNELRASGKPFVIRKTYVCGDGATQAVENSVSIMEDGRCGPLLTASVRALPSGPGERFTSSIAIARKLLAEQRARADLGTLYADRDWRLMLAAYLAEAEGMAIWTDDLCVAIGGDARANTLRIWELIKEGALVLEGPATSVERASVRVSVHDAATIEQHLLTIADR